MLPQKFARKKIAFSAFSLIEVTLSLGILAFALLAIFGLLSNGLLVSKQARTEMLAAQVASSILAERRVTPLAALTNNPLPPLTTSSGGLKSTTLDRSGKPSSSEPYFSLFYEVEPLDTINPQDSRVARVYLALAHPVQTGASFTDLAKAGERYETSTYIRLSDQ